MPRLRTLSEALDDAAGSENGFVFVADGAEVSRSYAQFRAESHRVAGALVEAGLRRGDVVALVIADSEQFLTALFGTSLAGLVPASLYPPATTADLARYFESTLGTLRAAGARAVVTTAALKDGFEQARGTCPDLATVLVRETLDASPLASPPAVALDDIAFVQYTSGSTSRPKGVALSHRSLAANITATDGPDGLALGPADVAVSWLPLYHDMGLVGQTLGAVYEGCRAVLLTPHAFVKRPAEWLRAITRYRGTVSFAPNFAYDLCVRRVKDRDLGGLDLSSWRVAGCGAEPIHASTLAAFAEKFRPVGFRASSFVPSYGLAEHVLAATFAPRDRAPRVDQIAPDDLADRRIATPSAADAPDAVAVVSCGRPFPGHQLRIVDEAGADLPDRRVGEILLAGPSVMLGYYKQDELTAWTLRGGWLHTGDLGYTADGELFVCGRVKDIIILNGRKYHPQDLEWAANELPGVRRGRVVAFGTTKGPASAERVVMVVEPSGTAQAGELVDAIRRRVGDLFGVYVDEVVLVPSGTIGRTTSGKVQRAGTRARYERGTLTAASDQAGLRA